MKILLIHNFYRFRGGEDRYVEILDRLLQADGHGVIRFFSDSRDIESYNFLKKCHIPLALIHSRSAGKRLEALIRAEKPDVAVVHNLFPLFSLSLLTVLKRHAIPILKRLENYKFLCLNGLFLRNNFRTCESCKCGNFWPGIFRRCYQRSIINSTAIAFSEYVHRKRGTARDIPDRFLASSHFVKSKFVEGGFSGDKIVVYPNFLDFDPLEDPEPPGDYAVYLGRLSVEKGLKTLMTAFKDFRRLKLKIVGEGPLKSELMEYARDNEMDHVTFEGFLDGPQKIEVLKKALVAIFPSQCYESFGNTIIESYACGLPVIASNIGVASELVREGVTGFFFQPRNFFDLQDKLSLIMADMDRVKRMKQNALDQAKQFYTYETGYKFISALLQYLTVPIP